MDPSLQRLGALAALALVGCDPAPRVASVTPAAVTTGASRDTSSNAPESAQGDEVPAALRGIVEAHNRHRAAHCAPPLAWSSELAATAQRHAERLRSGGCNLVHSQGPYGENLFGASPAGQATPDVVVDDWYNEVTAYDMRHPGFGMRTGHFTQVVWKDTTRVGCAVARCQDSDVWVCNYDPPGNIADQFARNVSPTGCR